MKVSQGFNLQQKTIDQDILNFLRYGTLGSVVDKIETASNYAYRDMNRTLRFYGLPDEQRRLLRNQVLELFKKEVPYLEDNKINSQEEFDRWHHSLSDSIKDIYTKFNVYFTHGQAQKWINMTLKYLYILEYSSFTDVFGFLHVPWIITFLMLPLGT